MSETPILVTAAAPRVGGTGAHVARLLGERGHAVRAMVHREDERADALRRAGAEVVVADFLDLDSLRRAVAGTERAYFCHPWTPRVLEGATNFAVAAREAGHEVVVDMSQYIARPGHPSPATREHWLAERVLDWARIGAVHIRPGLFADNLLGLVGPSAIAEDRAYLPFGEGRHAPVTAEDVARVAVAILLDAPGAHAGATYPITGPVEHTIPEMIDELGAARGRPIELVDVSVEAWVDGMRGAPYMNDHFAAHLEQVAIETRAGAFTGVHETVEELTGAPATGFSEFADRHAAAFGGSAAPAEAAV